MRILWVLSLVVAISLACGGGSDTTEVSKSAKKLARKMKRIAKTAKQAAKVVTKRAKCLSTCDELKTRAIKLGKRGKSIKSAEIAGEALKCASRCEAGARGAKGKGVRKNEAGCVAGCQDFMIKAAKHAKRGNHTKAADLQSKAWKCADQCN